MAVGALLAQPPTFPSLSSTAGSQLGEGGGVSGGLLLLSYWLDA